ncbi:dienelactone hydrolase family protein [Motiliproteus sp. MSK22-1]|uniref:dienelactone hydrolase family protein n=1 Tax=Motiliproteus sp. MSK22-1 TaxID=1897630 RepID=UPI000976EC6F|nr:dienelactone hydrolase family protein [Motiliproteus sp. MSK22-1]OMH38019.1 hypothetical protein BGP75_06965 [Motiliproteus sp. MSK22-1]
MNRKKATDYDQKLLDLYDEYVHSSMSRRGFLDRAAALTVSGIAATTLAESLLPDYALAVQVSPDDSRILAQYQQYESANGSGTMRGLLARPANSSGKLPVVLVVHENRGLNPYIEDVARRLAVSGYMALAPDALTPLGGYPGTDDEGKLMQKKLDRNHITEDFVAAAEFLKNHPDSNGKVGVVGFCFGGGMANTLAVRLPYLKAAVPFYGRQPKSEEVANIKASLLIHNAELDKRINAGWPAYEEALKKYGKDYQAYMYAGANHGFHNDTTPRYDQQAAELAWQRTLAFFESRLK